MQQNNKVEVVKFHQLGDKRGHLVVIESNKDIPFEIERIFYIYGSDKGVIRGQHANKDSEFILINVSGKSKVKIDYGYSQEIIELNEPHMGVYIPKMIWKEMYDFSEESVLLVLSNSKYNSDEYIRDYGEYLKIIQREGLFNGN
ncbi:sugar 3,4-ketoisomerase [Fusibacter sp. JL216-2]|uniref:sugar 3,4-ketoisomerase n=1 Tax=Fusibacter sp. JL216-2 TaxID=3071453 RepID=UPI003D338322